MKQMNGLIFGYNEYAQEIAKNIFKQYSRVTLFALKEDGYQPIEKNQKVAFFDLSDEWDDIKRDYKMEETVAFCALEDDAQNIFLTISLRATFHDLTIVSLAKNNESANKLLMAGANKVIPVVQTTANRIVDILERPITSKVLHDIMYGKSSLKIVHIEVKEENAFGGQYPSDIDWSCNHGIIVLSVIHENMQGEFIYSSKAKHQIIKKGDIFVVVGYEEDLVEFEKLLGSRIV